MSMFRKEIRIGENMEYEKIPKITVVDSSYTKSVNCKLSYEFRNHANGLYFREGNKCDGCVYYDNNVQSQSFEIREFSLWLFSCPAVFGGKGDFVTVYILGGGIFLLGFETISGSLDSGKNGSSLIAKGQCFGGFSTTSNILLGTNSPAKANFNLISLQSNGLYFREGNKCDGCVYYDNNVQSQSFEIRPIQCPNTTGFIEYICLASFKFDNETTAVVTGTRVSYDSKITQFLCWVFTGSGSMRKIVVFNAADCNDIKLKLALAGEFVPRSMFDVVEKPPKGYITIYII
jgi:hypothetical protein